MDLYHVWFDLLPGQRDVEVVDAIHRYLGKLTADGDIAGFRVTRRKLGLGLEALGEFHVTIEVDDLAQLDRAFGVVSRRADPVETLHHDVNGRVRNFRAALYRDFPDPHRHRGDERF